MTQGPADDLQRLLAEEPFVRALAQQLVAADADEAVQQTFLRALQQGSGGVERPRHWLARILRNVASNLRRGDRRRQQRQRAVAVRDLAPSSAELMEREERRRALVAAVDGLPPSLRTVVLLRWFEGLPPRQIAEGLGVPVATVSTQLHRALELLRQRLDAAHGGERRAWLLPLTAFAAGRPGLPLPVAPVPSPLLKPLPVPLPLVSACLTGVIAMTTNSKIVTAAAVLLACAGTWMFWPGDGATAPSSTSADNQAGLTVAPASAPHEAGTGAATDAPKRQTVDAPTAAARAKTGSLIVHVRYGDDHAPAQGVMMTVYRPGSDPRFEGKRSRTDETGTARFPSLAAGRLAVTANGEPGKRVEITAGQPLEIDYDLEVGLTVAGVVVAAGVPVPGALVEVTWMAHVGVYPEVVATTDDRGRFTARATPEHCLVGARAAGYTASPLRFLMGKEGNRAEVELVLGAGGGCVDGVVVDGDGQPVADAVVIIGGNQLCGIGGGDNAPPFPALARSDAAGRFLAVGIPAGAQPVQARAPGFAPWQGTCDVTAGANVPLRVPLGKGATIRGSVRDAANAPVGLAEVQVGQWRDLAHYRTATAADGSFELTGLPAGLLQVRAEHDDLGKAEQKVQAEAGLTVECTLPLSRGLELVGRVVDADGQPVAKAMLEFNADPGGGWFAFVQSDAQGRFAAANCPEAGTVRVTARCSGFEELQRRGVDPKAGELVLQLVRAAPRSVRITGTVVGPDGRPVVNAMVSARRTGTRDSSGIETTDNSGRFELRPVAPGRWQLEVQSNGHPEFVSEVRELAANATWDLGTITLPLGGTAVVRRLGEGNAAARFYTVDAAETRTWSVDEVDGQLRTNVLAPGDYRLLVFGKGVAAGTVPFTIHAGQETVVDVQLQPASAMRFQFELPPGPPAEAGVRLRVQRGGVLVGRAWAQARPDGPATTEMWLSPGDYELAVTFGELRGTAAFTVGGAADAPVRVQLR